MENSINGIMSTLVLMEVNTVAHVNTRSAWGRGVLEYVNELYADLRERAEGGYITADDIAPEAIEKTLLNGAHSFSEYSNGGCSLVYDGDIARRLCTPSELKKTRDGERNPNARETWLDVQTRALIQAMHRIRWSARIIAR